MSSRQSSDDSNSCGEDDATQMNHADTRRTEDKKGPEGLQTDGIQSESFERSKTDAGKVFPHQSVVAMFDSSI